MPLEGVPRTVTAGCPAWEGPSRLGGDQAGVLQAVAPFRDGLVVHTEHEITGHHPRAVRRVFDEPRERFQDGETFELEWPQQAGD